MTETLYDPVTEWIEHVQPIGLVLAPSVLRDLGLIPERQTPIDTGLVAEIIADDPDSTALPNPWTLFERVLGWDARYVAGSPGGPPLPDELTIRLADLDTTLQPAWAVRELGTEGSWQLLVRFESADPDVRGALAGWEATPHQRFERLLRETGIPIGILLTSAELRLVYAPKGETSGWLSFPLRPLATVQGRSMLGGLKLCLDAFRLFNDADERRLPALLKRSREEQAAVSTALAGQVLGALHELLRGFHAAEPDLIAHLARTHPDHLYEGLLTVLLRLVFLLYAEDRDLIPSRTDAEARTLYETSYSVRGLFAKLIEDQALNPDTMDERRGAWGRLLALFRLVHLGDIHGFVKGRGGKLFDPNAFPFLEGRAAPGESPRVATVSDGCVLRLLEGLMTLENATTKVRERLSYRTLDVEQIGSVYETVMGFTVEEASGPSLAIKAGKNNRTPVFINLARMVGKKPEDRIKSLKEDHDRGQLTAKQAKALKEARTIDDIAVALDSIVDERASPGRRIISAQVPILQPTDERRRTGSHYTPRSLTEPIVRHALDAAFERIGKHAHPEEVLALKVCDPACGSGAFLVEACRQLATRLVEAWTWHRDARPVIPPDEDEELHARRLVAQRCIYGVDKNPLAADLAKLSLWLATLAKDHEFTFLDHAVKAGDSLVGLTQAQIAAAHWDASKPGLPLFRQLVRDRVAEAMKRRAEIQAAPDDVSRSIQETRHQTLEVELNAIRVLGDAVIAAFFAADKPKAREKKRAEVESWLTGSTDAASNNLAAVAASLRCGPHPLIPFHWEIEFPEVFIRTNGGFDAIVGNPPFLGGTNISERYGMEYFRYLSDRFAPAGHHCDLVAYFFRRAFDLVRQGGCLGLIATNTISQGDTREGGLVEILKQGGVIIRATRRLRWPGEAAVVVKVLHIARTPTASAYLDGRPVTRISAFVVAGVTDSSPARLAANSYYSLGSKTYGQGFVFDDKDPKASPLSVLHQLRAHHPDEATRVFSYVAGEDLNKEPQHASGRFVIQLSDLQEEKDVQRFPELYSIVKEKVYPERMQLGSNPNNIPLRRRWWAYQAHRPQLYAKLKSLTRAICISRVSPHMAFCLVRSDVIFSEAVVVIADQRMSTFASLQSRAHEIWARFFASSMKDDLRYTPSDCFETFPFPLGFETLPELEAAGDAYHEHRSALMVSRNEGMTKTYNRFHDRSETGADIQRLRELHVRMDRAVLTAYGWNDIADRADPIFLDENNEDDHTYQGRLFWPSEFRDEILARLLALNAERQAVEIAEGTAPTAGGTRQLHDSELEDA